jgi:hypothetical protein
MNNKPYSPQIIHRFYAWLDRSSISPWIFYPGILLLLGIFANLLAWNNGSLAVGEIDVIHLFSFAWLVESLALGHYVLTIPGPLLDAYRKRLKISAKDYDLLHYEFTVIPAFRGTVFLIIGMGLGLATSLATLENPSAGPQTYIPWLTNIQWILSLGSGVMFTYFIVRQLRRLIKIFAITKDVPFSDMAPIYAFSRYTLVVALGFFVISNVNSIFLSPNNFESSLYLTQSIGFIIFALAIFYVPMRGINKRIVAKKENLQKDVIERIERMFTRIHQADEAEDYRDASAMRNMLQSLNDEKDILDKIPTWPWRPGTFTALLSTLLLPTILSLITLVLENVLGL